MTSEKYFFFPITHDLRNGDLAVTIPNEIHILLVDDSDAVREVLHVSLEVLGYSVHSTADPHQALRLFDVQHIDLALLDVNMPGMDGFALYAELCKSRTVPVVFISASHMLTEWQQTKNLEAVEFLSKPILLSDLDQSIQRVLQSTA